MFRYVAVVRDIRFEGQTLAEILWRWLEYPIAASITGNDQKRDERDANTANISQMAHTNWMLAQRSACGAQPFTGAELEKLRNRAGPDMLACLILQHTGFLADCSR